MTHNERTRKLTGRHALIGFVAFFAVVFAANGIMLYYALATHTGLETPDAYRRGIAYNDRIADADRQAARGWSDTITLNRAPARITVELKNVKGRPVSGLHLTGAIGRPATKSYDTKIDFREVTPGLYVSNLAKIEPGNWMVEFEASEGAPEGLAIAYRMKRRLWLNP